MTVSRAEMLKWMLLETSTEDDEQRKARKGAWIGILRAGRKESALFGNHVLLPATNFHIMFSRMGDRASSQQIDGKVSNGMK